MMSNLDSNAEVMGSTPTALPQNLDDGYGSSNSSPHSSGKWINHHFKTITIN